MVSSVASVAAALGLVLSGGPDGSKAESDFSFFQKGPELTVVRAETLSDSCHLYLKAFSEEAPESAVPLTLTAPLESITRELKEAWAPWSKKEEDYARDCEKQPCLVKLNDSEVAQMNQASREERFDRWLNLVVKRTQKVAQTSVRDGYEMHDLPVDPFRSLDRWGFSSQKNMPKERTWWVRRFDLHSDQLKIFRMILERRVTVTERDLTIWLHDAYVSHYFGSWGEWVRVHCDSDGKGGVLLQTVQLEVDDMKENDLLSRLGRSTIRARVRDQGLYYLEGSFLKIKQRVELLKKTSPQKSSRSSRAAH